MVYTDTAYSAGAIYSVRAYDTATNLSAAAFSAPPLAPTGLTALATNALVRLTWTEPVGAVGYAVKRSTASGGPYSVVGTTLSATYDDTTVLGGFTYYYVVAAPNSAGESLPSAEVSAMPLPAPPTLWLGAVSGDQISLHWSGSGFVLQQNSDVSNPLAWVNAPRSMMLPA